MSNIKTRTTALLAAAAALASFGTLSATEMADAAGPAKTKVTIKTQNGDFSGTVKSRKLRRCADQREITVYRQLGNQRNPALDEEVATDTSDLDGRRGEWETGNTGLRDGNRYYAYTPRIRGCKAGISRTVRTVLDLEN